MDTDIYTGTLVYRDVEFNFIFDRQNLRLVPPTDKSDEVDHWFLKSLAKGMYTFGDPIYLTEPLISKKCNECYRIVFLPSYQNSLGHINSVVIVDVKAYIIFKSSNCGMTGMQLQCPDINAVYSTRNAIDQEINSDGTQTIKTKRVSASDFQKQTFCVDEKEVETYFDVIQKLTYDANKPPLSLQSCLMLNFELTNDIDFIYRLYKIAQGFMWYLCYRKDIGFDKISIYCKSSSDPSIKFVGGELYVNEDVPPIDEKSIKDGRCIKDYYISGKEGSILTEITNNTLYMHHLPDSREKGQHINAARFVMIVAAFEWEFKKLYPNGVSKKDATIKAEETATEVLKSLIEKNKGALKKLYKSLLKNGIGFTPTQSKIVQVGKDLGEIITPFGKHLYSLNSKELDYSKMGERLAAQRNHYAHGDLDKDFIGDSLLDLIFLERILYAMQLKRMGISDINIKHSINDLFHCNLIITE